MGTFIENNKAIPSQVGEANSISQTFLAQKGGQITNVSSKVSSSVDGSVGTLVTKGKKTGYAATRTNPVQEVSRGITKGAKKITGTAGFMGRRAKADIDVLKKQFGR
jgi:hypothetical protein